jgi:hypothetical protein
VIEVPFSLINNLSGELKKGTGQEVLYEVSLQKCRPNQAGKELAAHQKDYAGPIPDEPKEVFVNKNC